MSSLLETTKIQERGTVTIPQSVRDRLGVSKGSTLAFIETDDGRIEIRALEADLIAALDDLGDTLKQQGLTLQQWIELSRKNRKRLFEKMYADLA